MKILNNVIKIFIFSFFILTGYQAKAAVDCKNKDRYLKLGDFDSKAGERVFFFKKMTDDLTSALEKGDTDQANCLNDLYQKSAEEEGKFWQAKALAEGCNVDDPSTCPDPETPRSLKFLEAIHNKMVKKLEAHLDKPDEPQGMEAGADCPKCLEEKKRQDEAILAEHLRTGTCCGTKDAKADGDIGVVRLQYQGISYNQCLAKIDKNKKSSTMEDVGSCVWEAGKKFVKGMFDGVFGIFSLPGELYAARSQIWAIITDSDKRNEFFTHIKNVFLESFGFQKGELRECLNDQENTNLTCQSYGEALGILASPALAANLFKIAKLGVKAATTAFKAALASTKRGAAFMAEMSKVTSGLKGAARVTKEVVTDVAKGAKGKVVGVGNAIKLAAGSVKIIQGIVKYGSPFAKGAAAVTKLLVVSPVVGTVKMAGQVAKGTFFVASLPAKVTDKAIIAGFNLGKRMLGAAGKSGTQVIASTGGAAATSVVVDAAVGAGKGAAVADATAAAGKGAAATGDAAAGAGAVKPGTQLELDFGPKGGGSASANPYMGKPSSSLQSSLTRTRNQITTLDAEIAKNPTDALKARRDLLVARRDNIQKAVVASQPAPPPVGTQLEFNFAAADPAANLYVGRSAGSLRSSLSQTNRELKTLEAELARDPSDAALKIRRNQLIERRDQIGQAQRVAKTAPQTTAPVADPAVNPYKRKGISRATLATGMAAVTLAIRNVEQKMKLFPNDQALIETHSELKGQQLQIQEAQQDVGPGDQPLAPPPEQ